MAFKISTKASKDATAQNTMLTIVFDDSETERALATSAAVVRWQSWARRNGIPETATLKMSELKAGLRGEVDVFTAAKSLTPEQKAALIKQLQG